MTSVPPEQQGGYSLNSPGPTEVDPDSDSDRVSVITLSDGPNASEPADTDVVECLSPPVGSVFAFWHERIPRLAEVFRETTEVPNILWALSGSLNGLDNYLAQGIHGRVQIDRLLSGGYIAGFKVGITHCPTWRFQNPQYGYQKSGYHEMHILAVSDNPRLIAHMEILLIAHYRRYDKQGNFIHADGHMLCDNRNPGGESSEHGVPPFTCYVAIRRNPTSALEGSGSDTDDVRSVANSCVLKGLWSDLVWQ